MEDGKTEAFELPPLDGQTELVAAFAIRGETAWVATTAFRAARIGKGGKVEKAARLLRLPTLLLKAALIYAREFPEEIAADREAGHRPLADLESLVPNHLF